MSATTGTAPPTQDGKPYHHGDLRQALLTRAGEVIGSEGIEALTLRGLARDLGVSHGAPNRHFRSKADLLATLAIDGHTALADACRREMSEAGNDPYVQLNTMSRAFLRWALEHPVQFRAMTHPDIELFTKSSDWDVVDDMHRTALKAVEAAQRHGYHSQTPANIAALLVEAVPFGAAMLLLDPMARAQLGFDRVNPPIDQIIELVVPTTRPSSTLDDQPDPTNTENQELTHESSENV